jgi:hypothetical protein
MSRLLPDQEEPKSGWKVRLDNRKKGAIVLSNGIMFEPLCSAAEIAYNEETTKKLGCEEN